jgi:hypothetical protein
MLGEIPTGVIKKSRAGSFERFQLCISARPTLKFSIKVDVLQIYRCWSRSLKRLRKNRPTLFRGRHFEDEIIILCVRSYLRYSLSYRDLEEMMAERGALARPLDHLALGTTLCSDPEPTNAARVATQERLVSRVDETTFESLERGNIYTARSILMATPLILCCRPIVT